MITLKLLYHFAIIFGALLLWSCSSSTRFTDDETGNEKSTENRFEDYDDPAVLESITGVASYYADKFHGRMTANSEIYDMHGLTAAHPSYPFDTIIRVVNLENDKSVVIRINDRMPKHPDRIIDLSYGTAQKLDMITSGLANVRLDILEWGQK